MILNNFNPEDGAFSEFICPISGCRIYYNAGNDREFSFNITFKTPTSNDMGIPHILEHSIFTIYQNGESYNLLNRVRNEAICSFVNAVTFPDKTCYMASTPSEDYFIDILGVFLDNLLNPNILSTQKIFDQEAWKTVDKSVIGGIVYNEMVDVLKSDFQVLFRGIFKSLFPDNSYQFSAAGLPKDILNSKYEDLVEYHNSHYRLDNCYIVLSGNLNIENIIKLVEEKTIIRENNITNNVGQVSTVTNFKESSILRYKSDSKHYICFNFIAGSVHNKSDYYGIEVLRRGFESYKDRLLYSSLKKISDTIELNTYFINSISHYPFGFIISSDEELNDLEIYDCIKSFILSILKNGFSGNEIDFIIDKMRFATKFSNYNFYPTSLKESIRVLESALYDYEANRFVNSEVHLDHLLFHRRHKYFEEKIGELLNKMSIDEVIYHDIEKGVNTKSINPNTQQTKKKYDDESIFREYRLSDWANVFPIMNNKNKLINHNTYYKYSKFNGSNYFELTYEFDISDFTDDKLVFVKLLTKVLFEVKTNKQSVKEIMDFKSKYLNELKCGIEFDTDSAEKTFYITVNSNNCFYTIVKEFILEVIFSSDVGYSLESSKKIKQIINENYGFLNNNMHIVLGNHANSFDYLLQFQKDLTEGIGYFKVLESFKMSNSQCWKSILDSLKSVIKNDLRKCSFNKIITNKNSDFIYEKKANKIIDYDANYQSDYHFMKFKSLDKILEWNKKDQYYYMHINSNLGSSLLRIHFCHVEDLKYSELIIVETMMSELFSKEYRENGVYGYYTRVHSDKSISLQTYRDPQPLNILDFKGKLIEYLYDYEIGNIKRFIPSIINKFNDFKSSKKELLFGTINSQITEMCNADSMSMDKRIKTILLSQNLDTIQATIFFPESK
ncbi:MAG: insulinase family protein [Clostridiales bacterium]|nr:insulinase family protein [Clostridiales bacterium]